MLIGIYLSPEVLFIISFVNGMPSQTSGRFCYDPDDTICSRTAGRMAFV